MQVTERDGLKHSYNIMAEEPISSNAYHRQGAVTHFLCTES